MNSNLTSQSLKWISWWEELCHHDNYRDEFEHCSEIKRPLLFCLVICHQQRLLTVNWRICKLLSSFSHQIVVEHQQSIKFFTIISLKRSNVQLSGMVGWLILSGWLETLFLKSHQKSCNVYLLFSYTRTEPELRCYILRWLFSFLCIYGFHILKIQDFVMQLIIFLPEALWKQNK